MHALGIPTTRSLAVVTTGEPVYRETALRGAVLTRVAASHIRVGTFQYLAARRDNTTLRALADYAIARHDPHLVDSAPGKYLQWFRAVMDRQASLIASWQVVGFIHGVMNTDNMAVSGETIDYGPCAFMDSYHPKTVFSSIDHGGRYAYGNQPAIGQWNLARFAETLLPLLDPEPNKAVEMATEILEEYPAVFESYWLAGMRKKLGLQSELPEDKQLVEDLLDWMQDVEADFTNTFHDLSSPATPSDDTYQDERFRDWHTRWQQRLQLGGQTAESSRELMHSVNPFVIPRNHRVEEALSAAAEHNDLSVMHRLLEVLSKPYEPNAACREFQSPPPPSATRYQTFCGT
jgi:uncharacterized protein YdiU (UPF0061 family)